MSSLESQLCDGQPGKHGVGSEVLAAPENPFSLRTMSRDASKQARPCLQGSWGWFLDEEDGGDGEEGDFSGFR